MAKKEKAPINWEIRSASQFDDGAILFALDIQVAEDRVLTVYNCRVVDGQKGNFISFPARKGKDGKYYSHAYLQLTDDEQEEIIEEVSKTLATDRKSRRKAGK